MLLVQEFATGQSGIGYTPLDWKRPVLRWYSAEVTELSSLLLYRISNNITFFLTQNILRIYNVSVLQWPAKSPVLSPIEHLWDYVGRQVRERHDVNNIRDLERALQAEWVRIPLQAIRKLICSMRRRCLEVLAANGGHTMYWAVSKF